jgi:ubiquinone/menaquinone biosynthesis C-methylase UbiE
LEIASGARQLTLVVPMAIPHRLISLLRDPNDLGALQLEGAFLVNHATQQRFPVVDSIPTFVEPDELGPLNRKFQRMYDWLSHGYDFSQRVGDLVYRGKIARLRRQLAAMLALRSGQRCLYTSIGTGSDLPYLAEQVPLPSIDLVGLDLSLGMLKRCQKKLRAFADTSLLVQANAERLPFAERTFDVVLHVGGINFFDHPAIAAREMLRVAQPGALILIADETKEVVTKNYQRSPFTRAYFKDAATDFNPRAWVPEGAVDATYEELWEGKGYCLTFRAARAG